MEIPALSRETTVMTPRLAATSLGLLAAFSLASAAQGTNGVVSSGSPLAVCLAEDTPIQFVTSSDSRDGLITHDDGLGDTAQREGWYWLGVWIREKRLNNPWPQKRKLSSFSQVLKKLEPNGDGVFVRAPGLDPFGRDNNTGTTRDQLVPLVAAMGVWGQQDSSIRKALQRLWDAMPEDRWGKHDFQGCWRSPKTDHLCSMKIDQGWSPAGEAHRQ